MEIPVLRFSQGNVVLYVGRMLAHHLLEVAVIDEWRAEIGWDMTQPDYFDRQGYQRRPYEEHYWSIADFLRSETNPLMPNAALLSIRERDYGMLNFREVQGGDDHALGYLDIPEGTRIFIVDYQHRLHGLRHAIDKYEIKSLQDFMVPVIILVGVSKPEEMRQFFLVNRTQKKVDTDLAYALLLNMMSVDQSAPLRVIEREAKWMPRAIRLSFSVAANATGPWAGRIRLPNDPREEGKVVTPKSFAQSLRPLLSSRNQVMANYTDAEILTVLDIFWRGVEQTLPECFRRPDDFAIQKTSGIFPLHRILPSLILRIQASGKLGPDAIAKLLANAGRFMTIDFWRTGGEIKGYGGSGGHKMLAELILKQIQA